MSSDAQHAFWPDNFAFSVPEDQVPAFTEYLACKKIGNMIQNPASSGQIVYSLSEEEAVSFIKDVAHIVEYPRHNPPISSPIQTLIGIVEALNEHLDTLPEDVQERFNDHRETHLDLRDFDFQWEAYDAAHRAYWDDPFVYPLRGAMEKAKAAILKLPNLTYASYSEEEYITLLRYIQKHCVKFDEDDGDVSIEIEAAALGRLHAIYTFLPQEQRLEITQLLMSLIHYGYNKDRVNKILQEIFSSLSGEEEVSEFLDQVRHFVALSDSEDSSASGSFIKILSELIIYLPDDSQKLTIKQMSWQDRTSQEPIDKNFPNCASKEFVIDIILSWNTENTDWINADFADYADNAEVLKLVAKVFLELLNHSTFAPVYVDGDFMNAASVRRIPESQVMKVVEVTQALTYPTNIVEFVPLLPDEYLADRVADIEAAFRSKDKSQFESAAELFDLIGKHFSETDKKKLIVCMIENGEYISDPIGYSPESRILSRFFDSHTEEAIEMFKAIHHGNVLKVIMNGILSSIDVSLPWRAKSDALIDKGFEFFRYLAENEGAEVKLHLVQNIIYCFDSDTIDLFLPSGKALEYEAHGMPERIITFLEMFKEDEDERVREQSKENIEDTKQYTFEALCGNNRKSDIALELLATGVRDIDVSNLGDVLIVEDDAS